MPTNYLPTCLPTYDILRMEREFRIFHGHRNKVLIRVDNRSRSYEVYLFHTPDTAGGNILSRLFSSVLPSSFMSLS